MPDLLLDWERLLWKGRPRLTAAFRHRAGLLERYYLTDFRLIVARGSRIRELALHDIASVEVQSYCARGPTPARRGSSRFARSPHFRSTIVVRSRHDPEAPVVLRDVAAASQVALTLELLATGISARDALALVDEHVPDVPPYGAAVRPIAAAVAIVLALGVAAGGFSARDVSVHYSPQDRIYPGGRKRPHAEIVAFMEREVMPVARRVLGPLVGGADQVTCTTCHGDRAQARRWSMPGVEALPEPHVRQAGLELHNTGLDPQVRNAIYGYLAEADNQTIAGYMRAVVMPEMATVLGRPAYDFTKSYNHNRSRAAFGCYHCHKVN